VQSDQRRGASETGAAPTARARPKGPMVTRTGRRTPDGADSTTDDRDPDQGHTGPTPDCCSAVRMRQRLCAHGALRSPESLRARRSH
jgi:hypothetical protein